MKHKSPETGLWCMRLWLVTLLLLATAFAGCTDDDPAEEDEGPEAGVVTDPTDYSYLQNETDGAGWHIHDYWRGQDTLEVLDKVDEACQGCSAQYNGGRGALLASFRPDTDHVIPQGAKWVNVTASWDVGDTDMDHVRIFIRTANSSETIDLGEVQQGETLTFLSSNDDNDPPHHRLSLWEFELRAMPAEEDGSVTISSYGGAMTVEATRGLEILPWPPHPDFWQGADEIVLHESTRSVGYNIEAIFLQACAGCFGRVTPDDGQIVPYDASEVVVTFTAHEGSLPATVGLRYHGADRWTYQNMTPTEDDVIARTWRIPLEGNADSPYAKQSLWELELYNDQPTPVKGWTGEYTIAMKAVK